MVALGLLQWLREIRLWYPLLQVVIMHDSARSALGKRPSHRCSLLALPHWLLMMGRSFL